MENEFLNSLPTLLPGSPQVALGVGDDAALLNIPSGEQLVVTTDMLTDGVHFALAEHSPEQVGRKSLAVNLSDLAAMAAKPLAAFVALNVPSDIASAEFSRQLLRGMLPLANTHNCPIAGGDTNVTAGPLTISVTVLGSVAGNTAWLRSGAQPGDTLLVTGKLGGSLLGHHMTFEPRVSEALTLRDAYDIHAAMDISDGLALDLSRLLGQSGCGATLNLPCIPIAPASIDRAHTSGKTPLEHALGDGEDFELLLAAAPEVAKQMLADAPLACGLTDIGQCNAELGLRGRDAAGNESPLAATGFEHSSDPS